MIDNYPIAMPTIAFLFNGSETDYGDFYEIYHVIFAQVLTRARDSSFQLRGGTVSLSRFSSRMSAVERNTRGRYPSVGHTETDDKQLRATLAFRFAASAASVHHQIDTDTLSMTLLQVPVEAIAASELPIDLTEHITQRISADFPGYLGWFEVDRGDPLMLTLAANGLIPFCTYDDGILNWVVPFDHDPAEKAEISWAEGLGFAAVRWTTETPEYLPEEPLSEGGAASTKLLQTRGRPQHAEKVLRALQEGLDTASGGPEITVEFGREEFGEPRVDVRKTRDYCLNDQHEKGKHKALLFKQQLGITAANWYVLAEQLAAGIEEKLVNRPERTKWAVQYEVKIPVTGPNGVTRLVTSGWKIEKGQPPFLTSAYIEKGAETDEPSSLAPLMVDGVEEVDFFRRLFDRAHAHALQKAEEWTPTPMWIVGFEKAIPEGMIGSAWVELQDGKSPFARWLRKHQLCSAHSRSRRIPAGTRFQSVEKAQKYSEAFARALRLNGVACNVGWRLD
ncbi:MAG TPA: hypothetical protein VHX60_04995 [Acidobacteriaceae bacterium]|jgi:hypothetical protein|nr:hypothetical protein [Acidobacteriaceae bacterium]